MAARKIEALLKRGAYVTCVSKDFSPAIRNGVKKNRPRLILKRVPNARLTFNGARLVIAATSDRDFNRRVARACRKKKILVNVVDDPELCDFYVPAVVQRGPLQIAISTEGKSPLFARRLREELEKVIPHSTGTVLEKLGRIRQKALKLKEKISSQ